MVTNSRPAMNPDSVRSGVAVAAFGELVTQAEEPIFQAHLGLVKVAPGAALLVWGPHAICLAYNRAYRSLAALRTSALGKPLFVAQPELERSWKSKLDEAFTGHGVALDGLNSAPAAVGDASHHTGWLLPVMDADGDALGALALFTDVAPVLDPHRRVLQAAAQDIKEITGSVRLVAERLARAPRVTPERCSADMGRVVELTGELERLTHDMSLFARLTSGGVQVAPRLGDLGAIVRAACDELTPAPEAPPPSMRGDSMLPPRSSVSPPSSSLSGPPSSRPTAALSMIRVNAVEAQGSWDPEVMRWIVVNLVTVARKNGFDGSEIGVSVTAARDAVTLLVRGEGKGLREEEMDLFDPTKRGVTAPPSGRSATGLGLFIARELSAAHSGRLTLERTGMASFAIRVIFPRRA